MPVYERAYLQYVRTYGLVNPSRPKLSYAGVDCSGDGSSTSAMNRRAPEDSILRQLSGVTAIDQAARDLVDRQRRDRRNELERLARNLQRLDRPRAGVTARHAVNLLLVLTSYEGSNG